MLRHRHLQSIATEALLTYYTVQMLKRLRVLASFFQKPDLYQLAACTTALEES